MNLFIIHKSVNWISPVNWSVKQFKNEATSKILHWVKQSHMYTQNIAIAFDHSRFRRGKQILPISKMTFLPT